jgi:hypothetical protein
VSGLSLELSNSKSSIGDLNFLLGVAIFAI